MSKAWVSKVELSCGEIYFDIHLMRALAKHFNLTIEDLME